MRCTSSVVKRRVFGQASGRTAEPEPHNGPGPGPVRNPTFALEPGSEFTDALTLLWTQ